MTISIPQLNTLSVLDAAELLGITPWQAFEAGARLRTEADVEAMAATAPPMTPQQIAELDAWCARVAVTPVATIAEWFQCSYDTAEHVRDLIGGAR